LSSSPILIKSEDCSFHCCWEEASSWVSGTTAGNGCQNKRLSHSVIIIEYL
jgi:hypothetical protein